MSEFSSGRNRAAIVGIVSRPGSLHDSCADRNEGGIATKVAAFHTWIYRTITQALEKKKNSTLF